MTEHSALEQTNRMNLLFDFYQQLLTEKQRTCLTYYFHEDLSLGEIAAESGISRQAVYEHIKRAGQLLEDYEAKLQLLAKHAERKQLIAELEQLLLSEGSRSLATGNEDCIVEQEHLRSILMRMQALE